MKNNALVAKLFVLCPIFGKTRQRVDISHIVVFALRLPVVFGENANLNMRKTDMLAKKFGRVNAIWLESMASILSRMTLCWHGRMGDALYAIVSHQAKPMAFSMLTTAILRAPFVGCCVVGAIMFWGISMTTPGRYVGQSNI